MRKKTWTVIAVANDTRHLWSCLQKATDAHDAMRQCAAEMGAVDPLNFQIIGAIRGGGPSDTPARDRPVVGLLLANPVGTTGGRFGMVSSEPLAS